MIPGNASIADAQKALIGLPLPLLSPPGLCNTYIPNQSTLDRFVWFIKYLSRQGFYVAIVHQANSDMIFKNSPSQWLRSWRWLMETLQHDAPEIFPKLIIDPVNEPEVNLACIPI